MLFDLRNLCTPKVLSVTAMTFNKSSESHDQRLNTVSDGRSMVGRTIATCLDRRSSEIGWCTEHVSNNYGKNSLPDVIPLMESQHALNHRQSVRSDHQDSVS